MQLRKAAIPAVLVLFCHQVQAGGIMLYEIGTDNAGLANAGATAQAQGPWTMPPIRRA